MIVRMTLIFIAIVYFIPMKITKEKEAVMKVDATTEIVNNTSMVQESSGIKDEKELRRPRSIMKEFSLNTSTHDLPGIARSESIHNCVFWSISFICFTGIMIYFVAEAILEYFKYPAQIDVDIIRE